MMAALKAFSRLLQRTTVKNASRSFYIYSPDALTPQRDREPSWKTAEDAVQAIESGKKKKKNPQKVGHSPLKNLKAGLADPLTRLLLSVH